MRITVLNGSPRKQNTAGMVEAFAKEATTAGHEVDVLEVASMNIAGCRACEYCHDKGEGTCVQEDDMGKVIASLVDADAVVYASPIFYSGMTAQIVAAIQRVYCIGKPPKATKSALLLSSGTPNAYAGAIGQYKGMIGTMGLEDAGIVTAAGEENGTEEKLAEVRAVARAL